MTEKFCQSSKYKLVKDSPLDIILKTYSPPEKTANKIAKIVADNLGGILSEEFIKDTINNTINPESGQPNWEEVIKRIRLPINRIYHGKSPFPKGF